MCVCVCVCVCACVCVLCVCVCVCVCESHHYFCIPFTLQYPAIFCKLVKRSLSCDPIRRPTLPQILSIIKKDSKIIAMMTGRKTTAGLSKVRSSEHDMGPADTGECVSSLSMHVQQSRVESEHYPSQILIESLHPKCDISELPFRARLLCNAWLH